MSRIEEECAELAGRPFNPASPQQLAEVLYSVLKVCARVGGGCPIPSLGQQAARQHAGTAGSAAAFSPSPRHLLSACPPTPASSPGCPAPLQLPPPTGRGRSSAKTHLRTDEQALEALRPLSPLPGLVLEYRALQVGAWGLEEAPVGG